MGIDRNTTLKDLCHLMEDHFKNYKDYSMIELGNQEIRKTTNNNDITSKKYFTDLGMKHISIDLNGLDGAIPLDLCTDIENIVPSDIVTNFGTSEHVSNQYSCFKNIHNFCKPNGLIWNLVPPVGTWPGHCDHYYTLDFFDNMASINNYKILKNTFYNKDPYIGECEMIIAIFKKINNEEFAGLGG